MELGFSSFLLQFILKATILGKTPVLGVKIEAVFDHN